MFEEDAVARMEELGHVFFIFVNARRSDYASCTSATGATTG